MKKRLLTLGLMAVLVQGAWAWRPAGWVFHNHPWAYDSASGDWHWFNTADRQWVVNMSNGQWARLPNSALATGWVYYQWAFAFAQSNGRWHWINGTDRQWVVNMRTAAWSRFGVETAPAGMVLIPRGTNAGTNPLAPGEIHLEHYPATYNLTVPAFYMDRRQVTKALWDEVYTWALDEGYTFDNPGSGKAANHPVHSINWYDAVKWCNARSEREGRPPVYRVAGEVYRTGRADIVVQTAVAGYRLPSSDGWEYAARGGLTSRRFPWGDTIQHTRANYQSDATLIYDTSSTLGYHPDSGAWPHTMPVGSFAANGYGLFDMAGNVFEWCFDWYPGQVGNYRIYRGGSWRWDVTDCRVGSLFGDNPAWWRLDGGFRTVMPLVP